MFGSNSQGIIVFIIVCTVLILLLITFITVIIYRYQQKQNAYYKSIEELKVEHENARLHARLEMQEQTFQDISRDIHDNIGQKLTLAKLYLNTLGNHDAYKASLQINDAVKMISESINDLSDISRSLSSELVRNNGLIKALEFEKGQLEKSGLYSIEFSVSGETVFMETENELMLFRIAQEALNNVVKHSNANTISIRLHYDKQQLKFDIHDNGRGFVVDREIGERGTGLTNMARRAKMLNGNCAIDSIPGKGTRIKIEIPLNQEYAIL